MKKFAITSFIVIGLFFVRTEKASAQYFYPVYNTGWNQGWNTGWNQGWNGGWNTGWNTPYYNTGWNTGWGGGWNQGWNGGWQQQPWGWNGGFGGAHVAIPLNRGGWISVGLGW